MTDCVLLPVAGVEIYTYFVFIIGVAGGFISSVFGVGSGLIITPCLMMMGIPPLVSVSSQLNNAASTGFVSFLAYFKKRDVDIALGMYLFFGGLCGAILEFFFLDHFRGRIKIFAVIFLSFLAIIMFLQNVVFKNSHQSRPSGVSMRHWMIYIPFHRIFIRSRVEMSILVPFFIGIITGLLTSSLGGATSILTIPMLTYIIGRVSAAVTGTSFLAGFGINTVIIILHSLNGAPCDFVLVFLLISGGILGVMLGIFFLNYLPKDCVGILGSLIIIGVCIKFWIDVLLSKEHSIDDSSTLLIADWLKPFMDHYAFEYSMTCLFAFILFAWVLQSTLLKITDLIRKNS